MALQRANLDLGSLSFAGNSVYWQNEKENPFIGKMIKANPLIDKMKKQFCFLAKKGNLFIGKI